MDLSLYLDQHQNLMGVCPGPKAILHPSFVEICLVVSSVQTNQPNLSDMC